MNWQNIFERQIGPKLVTVGECWNFVGAIDTSGYGVISIGSRKDDSRRKAYTHRISYLAKKGNIPDGQQVQHKCHNRKCCNPEHLKLGYHLDNSKDMVVAGRCNNKPGKSGILGVAAKRDGKYFYWVARVYYPNKQSDVLYHGKDFFEACCARKSWEASTRTETNADS